MFKQATAVTKVVRSNLQRCLIFAGAMVARCLAFAGAVGISAVGVGCGSLVVDPGEGVGDPCVPSVEYHDDFAGFATSEIYIESGMPDCRSGICLANHFQGRVSCPAGQSEPFACEDDLACPTGTQCTDGLCLDPDGSSGCLAPGTSDPVLTSVCGQCSARRAVEAVYCSCRCGLAEGQPPEGVGDLCRCPAGYQCQELRPYLGGLDSHAGKYCVKEGTQWSGTGHCGAVTGYWEPRCGGTPSSDG